MATLIPVEGPVVPVAPHPPATHLSLREMHMCVDGDIEPVYRKAWVALVNEEGLLRNLPLNFRASLFFGRPLVGDVFLLSRGEWDAMNEEPEE